MYSTTMNRRLLMFALLMGVAFSLPNKYLKTLRTRNNTASNGRLGIFDGESTTIDKHKYLVGVLAYDLFYCAGAIVSDSYVLTLGDCVREMTASFLSVVAGSSDGTTGTIVYVKKIIKNPNYGAGTLTYDFALLKLKKSLNFGHDIGAVTLPSVEPKSGAALVAAGYGDTSALGSLTEGTLMQGTMKYVTAANCASYYTNYDTTFDKSMACAYNKGKVTMCSDDFGNPFTKGNVLYGMMAAGGGSDFCSTNSIPVIIADVYSAVDWINKYI